MIHFRACSYLWASYLPWRVVTEERKEVRNQNWRHVHTGRLQISKSRHVWWVKSRYPYILSYHTSAIGIPKNIAFLRFGMGHRRASFFRFSTSAGVITYLSSSKLGVWHRTNKIEVVILVMQLRFISPVHSANLIGGLART